MSANSRSEIDKLSIECFEIIFDQIGIYHVTSGKGKNTLVN